jgi:hypothetical protein
MTMTDIFKGNTDNVFGGAGRYLVAVDGTTKPEGIDDIISIAWPYNAVSPWVDLGYTKKGLKISRGHETQKHEVDQIKGAYDETVTGWTHEITTDLAETSVANLQLAWEGGTIDDHSEVAKVDTTVNATAASGQKVVTVSSKASLVAGRTVVIGTASTQEAGIIASIQADPAMTITLQDNLLYQHLSTEVVSQVAVAAYKELPFGRPTILTERLFAAVFMKPDGYMRSFVFWRVKLSGDKAEIGPNTYDDDNVIPLNLTAYEDTTDATLQDDEKVFKIFDEYETA